MRPALIITDKLFKKYRSELTITSGLDSCHSAGSLHYYGLAIDCRIWYFILKKDLLNLFIEELKNELGKNFDVILHKTHIHIEYDEK